MNKNIFNTIVAVFSGGTAMWILAGLWHNLVLPFFNKNIEPHHDGIFVMLAAYYILAALMTYLYAQIPEKGIWSGGLKTGAIVGILWVFPHGLAMAGIHQTSIMYEIYNTFWHVVEQGAGGIVIAIVSGKIVR